MNLPINFLNINAFLRDLKSGQLTLLIFTLVLAVMGVSSVTLFTQGILQGLTNSEAALLGGDRVLSSPTPFDPKILAKAKSLGLKTSETMTFLSMLVHSDDLALSEIKAIDEHYPLKGEMRASHELFVPDERVQSGPELSTVWLEASLFSLLNLKMNDFIIIGSAPFKITKVLTFEPDRGGEGLVLAPRALMNKNDVAKTEVIQPGSRQTYYLLLSGEGTALNLFDTWAATVLTPAQKMLTPKQARPAIKTIVHQAEQYIYLILGINLLLASLALSQVSNRFCKLQFNKVALLRCFGAKFEWILLRIINQILSAGLFALVVGYFLGFLVVFFTRNKFASIFLQKIEINFWWPLFISILTVVVLLTLFVLVPIYDLKSISPLKLLRRDAIQIESEFSKVSKLLKWVLMNSIGRLGVGIRYGISNLIRYLSSNIIQLIAFSLVLTCAWVLFLVRNDLLHTWQMQIPANAPNYFVINIDPKDEIKFKDYLSQNNIEAHNLYPVVRGQLLAVNNDEVSKEEVNTPHQRQLRRLLNLSYGSTLPKDNKIIQGKWFNAQDINQPLISIEQGFANRLDIHLGDNLKFQIGERIFSVQVASIRTVTWDSFTPNFYVIFSPGVIDSMPTTYMTSFYIDKQNLAALKNMIVNFPSINLIDITGLLKNLLNMTNTLSTIVEYLWGLTLFMTLILLLCTISANLDERKRNAILLRALGVGNQPLLTILLSEFIILGFFAGLLSVVTAYLIYAWLAVSVFNLPVTLNWGLLMGGPLIGIFVVAGVGWFGIRKTLRVSPREMLAGRRATA